MNDDEVRTYRIVRVEDGERSEREENVAHEEPLEIQVNGASVAVVMRTPGHDEELARGFLITERIVSSLEEIESLRHCSNVPDPEAEDNVMQVRLTRDFDLERFRRHMFASSSCGVCGKATIENACAVAPPLADDVKVTSSVIASLPAKLRASQSAFDKTGGLHAAGLFTSAGELLVAREDVGRHNAVDKVVGAGTLGTILLVSGRVSFEIVQKAAAARIPIVAGISAPSSLAVRMARALNITVVGFLRNATMNVYSAETRVS
jgi:FdhD protein